MNDYLKRAFALITAVTTWLLFLIFCYGIGFFHGAAWKDQRWKDAIDQFYQNPPVPEERIESSESFT